MPNFFISYRRRDQEGKYLAHMIFRELKRRYGDDNVFFDVDSRSPGLSFPVKVEQALLATDVMLVIIGPDWLRILDERRDDGRDWVRYEVAEGLKRDGLPVVPVWLPGVEMPGRDQLPKELEGLADRDGSPLDPFQDFDSHITRLLRDLERAAKSEKKEERTSSGRTSPAGKNARLKVPEVELRGLGSNQPRSDVGGGEAAKGILGIELPDPGQLARPAQPVGGSGTPSEGTPGDSMSAREPESKPALKDLAVTARDVGRAIPAVFVSVPATTLLALGYSFSLLRLPFVQANPLLTIAYGVLSGVCIGVALRWRRVWKENLAMSLCLIGGLLASYFSWVAWLHGYFPWSQGLKGLFLMVISPIEVVAGLPGQVSRLGSWSIWDYRPTGWALWFVWIVEGVTITGTSFFCAAVVWGLTSWDLCDWCGTTRAGNRPVARLRLRGHDSGTLRRRIEEKDLAVLAKLGGPDPAADRWITLFIDRCTGCEVSNKLSAYIMSAEPHSEILECVVSDVLLTGAEADEVERIGREVKAAAK